MQAHPIPKRRIVRPPRSISVGWRLASSRSSEQKSPSITSKQTKPASASFVQSFAAADRAASSATAHGLGHLEPNVKYRSQTMFALPGILPTKRQMTYHLLLRIHPALLTSLKFTSPSYLPNSPSVPRRYRLCSDRWFLYLQWMPQVSILRPGTFSLHAKSCGQKLCRPIIS